MNSNKTILFKGIVFLVLLINFTIVSAQNNTIVLNGGYTILNGGSSTTPVYLVVNQPSPLGIVRAGGGHINSEN